ncbi:MAG: hypothetical protein NZ874_04050 [Fimbriimonadales bacterium]|nr:hypothetical protein [Fimbriimonadales bacterium]
MRHTVPLRRMVSVLLSGVVVLGLCGNGFANGGQSKPKSTTRAASAKGAPAAHKPASPPKSTVAKSSPNPVSVAKSPPNAAPMPTRVSYGTRSDDGLAQEPLEGDVMEAVGVAPYPPNAASRAQARVQARRAAILDAQRQLVEQLYGVSVRSNSRLSERGLQDEVYVSAQGIVQGAQVVSERDWGDSYEVTLRWRPPERSAEMPPAFPTLPGAPSESLLESPMPSIPPKTCPMPHLAKPIDGYTGVVIDARGLGLQPSMAPRIRDTYGNTLWGNLEIAPETVIEYGLAGWARSHAELRYESLQARVGNNPLWLKAIAVQGAARNEVILSPTDAERLIRENARSGFLERLAVVFLY